MIRMLPRGSRAFSVLLLLLLLLILPACEGTPDSGKKAGNAGSGAISPMENTKASPVPKPAATEDINAAAAGREGQTTFVHRAASENIEANSTYVDDPLINGDSEAQLIVTRNWNPGGEGGTYNDHPVGVWYDSERERWAIYNEDREPMPDGAAFNVAVVPDPDRPVHRATPGNTAGNSTYLDIPSANGNPDVQLLITRTRNSGDEYNDHPVGVWYDSGRERWAIYNEDREPMPDGAAFNVAVSDEFATAEPDSSTSSEATGSQTTFVHRAASGNINENSTYMDDPLINGDPEAQLLITRNWNPGGEGGEYNDHPIGVWYDSGRERWAIYNEDREPMPEGVAFNVAISKADPTPSEDVASSDTGEPAKTSAGTEKKPEKPTDGTQTDDLPEGIPEYQDFYAKGNPETPADLISGNSSVGTIPPVKPFNFGRNPGGPEDKTLYLTIPALEMEGIPVFDTLSEEKLRDGAVHIPATGYPWQEGANVFIAGHRIGYPNTLSYYVFYRLDQLAEGDEILLQNSTGKEFKYRVTEQMVVGPENVDAMNAVKGRSIISLQTCTLPDYEERLIVRGELVKKST